MIESEFGKPFSWNGLDPATTDCCRAPAAVLVRLGYPDFMARYRYRDEAEARAVMGGSVADAIARECERHGWRPIDPDRAGDGTIGVIGSTAALRCGGSWVVKTLRGMGFARRVRMAWGPA